MPSQKMALGNIRRSVRTPSTPAPHSFGTQSMNASNPKAPVRAPHSSGTQPMNASNPVRMPSTRSPHSSAPHSMNASNPEALAPVRAPHSSGTQPKNASNPEAPVHATRSSGTQPMNASNPVRMPSSRSPHSSATQSMNASNPEALAPVRGTQPMNASNPVRMPSTRSPHSSATQSMNASNPDVLAPVRNIRKSTVNNFLKKYRKATNNSRPRIEIEPGMGTPVGEWAQAFITEINIILRQNAPLFCHDWRTLKMDEKRDIFHVPILDKFDIDLHLRHVEEAVYKYIGIRLRDFRCRLHRRYKAIEGDARLKRTRPHKGVSQENWEILCNWFDNPEFQAKSAKNTESRKGLVVPHCAGSVSFARFQAAKGLGRIDLYQQTHYSDERGSWVAPFAQERHEAMVARRDEATSENSPPPDETVICNEVLGVRRGYTCGLGHGVMPPSYCRTSHNPIVDELQRNVEEANRRLEAAEKHNEETERLRVESERQNAELRAQVQALQSFQARMESFMAQMGPAQ